MSYLVLARKWRPGQFDELIGQEHISQTLKNAIEQNRIAHAFLFCGSRGVGKTSTARILAKALMCSKSKHAVSCNECSLCEEISKGTSLDVIEIDGASNNGVDAIRELREKAQFLPAQQKYKIYIIDEVHMLSQSAFNALLKILEEPPPHLKFIFATTEVHKIPATILSRCQRFDFKKISLKKLQEHLEDIAKKENLQIEKEALMKIAKEAQGSLRDALSLLDQMIAFAGKKITLKDIQELLGSGHEALLFEFLEKIFRKESSSTISLLFQMYERNYDIKQISTHLLEYLRALLLLKISSPDLFEKESLLDLTDNELSQLKHLSNLISLEELEFAFQILLQTIQSMSHTLYPRFVFEMGLIRLLELKPFLSLESLVQRVEFLQKLSQESPSPRAISSSFEGCGEGRSEGWGELVEYIKNKKPSLAAILEHGYLIQWLNSKICLGFAKNSVFAKLLSDKENITIFEKIASDFLQTQITLTITEIPQNTDKNFKNMIQENENQIEILKKRALDHKTVQDIQKIFSGKVIDVNVQKKERN